MGLMNKILRIQRKIRKKINKPIICTEENNAIKLEGEVSSWQEVIIAGKVAAKSKYRGVINKITVKGITVPSFQRPNFTDNIIEGQRPDVLIIGGGVIGAAIARALSKWEIDLMLVEKECDVAMHASSRNDGMVHPGITHPGSLKAKMNIRGNEMFEDLAKELDVPFKRTGMFILFNSWLEYLFGSTFIIRNAKKNGAKGVKRVKVKEIRKIIPNIPSDIVGGVTAPTTGVCPPYEMTTALAENAIMNGLKLSLETAVISIMESDNKITKVITNRGTVYPKVVINAAGLFADEIAAMVNDQFFTIHPRKGEIVLLDKNKGDLLNTIVSQVSAKLLKSDTKGGALVKTAEGNILVGPTAFEQPYKEDYSTDYANVNTLLEVKLPIIKGIEKGDVITYLAGTRAATYKEDFIIEKSKKIKNLIYAAGIQSPGYASSPAIAEEIERITIQLLKEERDINKKKNFVSKRKGIPNLKLLSKQERRELISKRSDYGHIVCRCEEISKGEIIDAIHATIPALTLDAIKRRTRAGMGRCQGGFCTPLIAQIMVEETGKNMLELTKKGDGSNLVSKFTKS
jgi:glycerol-3-phosphate dehydrogenase